MTSCGTVPRLRPVADYQLEPALDRRLRNLGERKGVSHPKNMPS